MVLEPKYGKLLDVITLNMLRETGAQGTGGRREEEHNKGMALEAEVRRERGRQGGDRGGERQAAGREEG